MILDIADLQAAGISSAKLAVTSQGTDELSLELVQPVNSPDLLPPFGRLVLADGGVTRFVGWLDRAPRAASTNSQGRAYRITGPMRWLDRTPWFDNNLLGGIRMVSRSEGAYIYPIGASIAAILDAARALTSNAFAYVGDDLGIDLLQTVIPPETRVDSRCGDLLRRALKYVPTVIYWWEYPTVVVEGVSQIIPTIRFADADKLVPDHTLSESLYALENASPDPRFDLLFNAVTVYMLVDGLIAQTDGVTDTTGDASRIVDITPAAARTFVQTFEYGLFNIPGDGLAAALLKFYSRMHVDCSATMNGIDWSHRPGQLWSYAGILASPYQSFCHQVSRDFFKQTQTIGLGVPPAFAAYQLSTGAGSKSAPPQISTGGGGGSPTPPHPDTVTGPPFSLHLIKNTSGIITGVRILPSTLGGGSSLDLGFSNGDTPPKMFTLMAGVVQGHITIDSTTGAITARAIALVSTLGTNSETDFYVEIGSVGQQSTWAVSNQLYGPINVQICGGYDSVWEVTFG